MPIVPAACDLRPRRVAAAPRRAPTRATRPRSRPRTGDDARDRSGRRGPRRDRRQVARPRARGARRPRRRGRVACDDAHVGALAVVNAVGDVVGADGAVRRGLDRAGRRARRSRSTRRSRRTRANTTLVVVATDAALDKLGCHLVAQSAHDGLARALRPAHTRFDGDLAIALATGAVEAHLDRLRVDRGRRRRRGDSHARPDSIDGVRDRPTADGECRVARLVLRIPASRARGRRQPRRGRGRRARLHAVQARGGPHAGRVRRRPTRRAI